MVVKTNLFFRKLSRMEAKLFVKFGPPRSIELRLIPSAEALAS